MPKSCRPAYWQLAPHVGIRSEKNEGTKREKIDFSAFDGIYPVPQTLVNDLQVGVLR